MKKKLTEGKGFDELIFENRNKEYGAYFLRKRYSGHVSVSILVSTILAIFIVVIPFIGVITKKDVTGSGSGTRYVQVQMEEIKPPQDEIIVPPPAAPAPPKTEQPVKYVAPIIVDTVPLTEKTMPTVAEVQAAPPDNNNQDLTVATGNQEELIGNNDGKGDDEPFILVEVKPTFKGGDLEKFREWVQKRVVYPQVAQDNGIQGRVFLTFVIERDGSVSHVEVTRHVDPSLEAEAKKAIESSPKWTPGMQRGTPVRVRYSIFLNFTL
jgi:periplasmic protein TonB